MSSAFAPQPGNIVVVDGIVTMKKYPLPTTARAFPSARPCGTTGPAAWNRPCNRQGKPVLQRPTRHSRPSFAVWQPSNASRTVGQYRQLQRTGQRQRGG